MLATAHERRGEAREARLQLDSAFVVALRSDTDPTLMYWLGKALCRIGDTRRSLLLLDTVDAKRHPDNVIARAAAEALLGEVLVAQGDVDGALSHLEAALRDDSSKITLESLAHGVASSSDLERAIRLYEEMAMSPTFGHEAQELFRMAPYWLGRSAERSNDRDLAALTLEDFLEAWREADPALPVLLDARDRLDRLWAVGR